MSNWVPLKFDLMAKKVFGNENDTRPIRFLLKQILDIEVDKVKILNNEIIGNPYLDKKYSVDLIVEIEDKRIVVEINTNVTSKIIDRNLFYMARIMSRDIGKGEDYSKLHRHIQINFDFKGHHERPIERYKLISGNSILTDKIEIIRIDVPYFYRICYNEDASTKEKFIGLFNEENKIKAKKLIVGNKDMEEIYEKMDEYNEDIIGLYDVEARRKFEEESVIEEAREIGLKEGKEEGLKEGLKEATKNMLKENMNINLISKVTGLSIEEINELKSN